MRYRSQSVAYWYFALAMVLFGLQLAFGLLAAAKYLGPDPLLNVLPFDIAKVIATASDMELLQLSLERASLEDVFRKLTGSTAGRA